MNIQKLIAIVAAIAINCAVLGWFHAWTTGVATAAAAAASMQGAVTLPVINVHPSAAQLRELHRTSSMPSAQAGGGLGLACFVAPDYSFDTQCGAVANG
jgi:3-dehydroquinate dehydratase